MKAPAFDYARPKDVPEALGFLAQGGKAAAGTQSLGPMLNLRVIQPTLIVDLRFVQELKTFSENGDSVTLGACVTHSMIEDGKVPDPTGGFMREVAGNIAYRAVRNRGTVGGSLVHADPAADWPSALMLLGAVAIIAGPGGRREVSLDRFFSGIFETVLKPQEILTAVRIPKRSKAARFGYWKFCRKAGEFPQAIGGALTDPERKETRTVVGAVGDSPKLFLKLNPDISGIGKDAYDKQLHAVALKRAIQKVTT
jgi:aerobic carbon-monoxide dehydrogenase medium subunit